MEESEGVQFEEVNNWLIILKSNIMRELLQSLPQELILLFFEDVGDVELLQFLIREVYEELLQRVNPQDLKTKDVQQTDALPKGFVSLIQIHLLQLDFLVQLTNDEEKCLFVEILSEGVLKSNRLIKP